MEKRILAIIISLAMMLQGIGVNVAYAATTTEAKYSNVMDLKEKGVDEDNQFTSLSMKLRVLSDGNASVKYNMVINNDYLNNYRNTVSDLAREDENFPVRADYETTELYNKAVYAFLDSFYEKQDDTVLPTVKAVITYDKTYFGVPSGDQHLPLYTVSTGEEIGVCDLVADEDGNAVLTCTFRKTVYNRTDIEVTCSRNFILKTTLDDNETVVPDWNATTKMVTVQVVEKQEGLIEADAVYSIKQAAPGLVATPYIDYTLNLAVQDGYINGQRVIDELPEGLYVDSVTVDGIVLSSSDYTVSEGKLYYTYPKMLTDKSNAITTSKLTLRLYLNTDGYKNLMKTNAINECFENKAFLQDGSSHEILSGPATSKSYMKTTYMEKTGLQEDLYGSKFKWHVGLNAYFNASVNAYIVDTINAAVHTYDFTTGVTVTGGDDKLIATVHPVEVTSIIPYDTLTLADLDRLTAGSSNKQSVYYTYMDEDGVNQSVLIVPLNKYIDTAVNLEYYTTSTSDSTSAESTVNTFANKARLVWERINVDPVAIEQDFTVEKAKNIQSGINVVQNTYDSYDASKNEITWSLAVNQLGGTFDSISVRDAFEQDNLKLQDKILNGTGLIDATYTKGETTEAIKIPSEANKVDGKPFYRVNDTSNTNKKELEIVFGSVAEDENYVISVKTVITNSKFVRSTAPVTFSNTATAEAITAGNTCGNESTDTAQISNSIVKKLAVQMAFQNKSGQTVKTNYNHQDHTSKWVTTLNENRFELTDARAEETLPIATTLDRMSAFIIYDDSNEVLYKATSTDGINFVIDGNEVKATESEDGLSLELPDGQVVTWKETAGITQINNTLIDVSNNSVSLSFSKPLNYKFEYEFFLKYDEAYRKEVIANRNTASIGVVNLYAQYKGEDLISARNSNGINVMGSVIEKQSWYNPSRGTVTWLIYVNQDQVDLKGYTVSDVLKTEFDMDVNTFTIKSCSVSPLGQKTQLEDITEAFGDNVVFNGSLGFDIVIPEEFRKTTFCIQFETAITDNISIKDTTNVAFLKNGKNEYRRSDSAPNNMVEFNVEDFINSSPLSSLFVAKISSSKGGSGQNVMLSGAEFKMTAMQLSTTGWVENESRYNKTRTTKDNGETVFFSMERGILYKVEEVKAANGYAKEDVVKYIIFLKEGETGGSYPEGTIEVPSTMKYTKIFIENTSNGTVNFNVVGSDDSKLAGAEFKLVSKDNKVVSKTAVSDENGAVSFTGVDPGDYVLTQEKTADGYKVAGEVQIGVTVNEDGTCETTMEKTDDVLDNTAGNMTIVNELIPVPSVTPSPEPTETPSPEPTESVSPEPTETPVSGGTIVIINTAEDNAREGFSYRVTGYTTDGEKFCQEYVTDELGMIVISGLKTGTYVVQELMSGANVNYVIPDPQMVKITAKNINKHKVLNFHNKLKSSVN